MLSVCLFLFILFLFFYCRFLFQFVCLFSNPRTGRHRCCISVRVIPAYICPEFGNVITTPWLTLSCSSRDNVSGFVYEDIFLCVLSVQEHYTVYVVWYTQVYRIMNGYEDYLVPMNPHFTDFPSDCIVGVLYINWLSTLQPILILSWCQNPVLTFYHYPD